MFPDELEKELRVQEEGEQYCLNCNHFTGGESACANCGAILLNEEDDDTDSGSDFEDEY